MITAALLGNPNVGKTTLFNYLTGSNQYVGNWAGVTVEKKEGYIGNSVRIVDLPGIYAMDTYSNEEKISKEFLEKGKVDVIINIVDASSLNRNLYLTLQLKQFGKPIILVLNMIDVAEAKGIKIDYQKLSKRLGVTVIPISASKRRGIEEVRKLLKGGNFFGPINENDYHYEEDEKENYRYIEEVLAETITEEASGSIGISERIDSIVLNKYLAYPLFVFILFIIFKFTFTWVGQPLSDAMDSVIISRIVVFSELLLQNSSSWFRSLIIDGIIAGVGSVIVFLPIVMTLFLGISFLEDSGYMARAAFIMDRIMRKMGLSGKAFIPFIIGFGCSVPGIMSARTLESEKDRKLTALLVPLMSCNARLPVYALFASAFFPGNETAITFSLYLLGIFIAILIGIIFKSTIFKKDEEPFIIELPEYKLPEFKSLMRNTWEKGKGFLKKAGTIIFSMSVIIWFLSNFNFSGMTDMGNSFLAYIGGVIAPIFRPMGFGTWQNAVALLTGLMAKEVVVSTMSVVYGADLHNMLLQHFTPIAAYSYLVFILLYTPCVSVIAVMRKEFGRGMMALSVGYQLILAWVISFIVYNLGSLILI
ncbi:ferrous iron transport protein B [Lutispora saccharofermentans]|uniref:Ferrous iron transport protein B n=1 Tax=Lutispora saccharofermentans TaxID=3024236 RepID=A0ABT1NDK9_9FIRM|nr:ferrous iron transport protein B [Lutispora saccharofermentans]MCQ1528273.1 ferrous iron transport protein B [Lutispora saccharofermentans]